MVRALLQSSPNVAQMHGDICRLQEHALTYMVLHRHSKTIFWMFMVLSHLS